MATKTKKFVYHDETTGPFELVQSQMAALEEEHHYMTMNIEAADSRAAAFLAKMASDREDRENERINSEAKRRGF